MSEINLLSSKIYNRIAAGEVVERPFSVVKELVENSIDAGSKNISVEISDGGKSVIRVFDDGSGIEKDQLKKALLPHATSKIATLDDLDDITTLGFRGEALASIASVSKITITSKPENQQSGARISAEGGNIGEVIDDASPDGTEIVVRNLFYNTPAREKFLKTDRGEESDISAIMAKFILGNPNVAFKYVADGKVVLQSFGDGLESAMISVYGSGIIKDCFYIDSEKNGIKIKGYIGKQYFSKPNRSYQSSFMNGRYVVNQTISAAVTNAYSSYMMKRQYPFYVLSVELPPETVDVNVHPNKTDVRFSDNRIVYGAIYSVLSKVLDGSGEALNIIVEKNGTNTNDITNDYVTHNGLNQSSAIVKEPKNVKENEKSLPYENYSYNTLSFCDSGKIDNLSVDGGNNAKPDDIFAENKAYLESLEKKKEELLNKPVQQVVEIETDLRFVGQVLNTFLVFDDGNDIYFVDQHAAHERILFDKFMDQIKSGTIDVQPLLIPYIENVNQEEYTFLLDNIKAFDALGIEISDFGKNSIKISTLPTCFIDMNVKGFLFDVLSDLRGLKSLSIDDILREKIAQKACKAAIKSGDSVSDGEVVIVAEAIKKNMGLKCPHGRPVVVKITRTEIDKWFKRIV